QTRDVRMIQRGEHLALELEALERVRIEQLAAHELDRDLLLDRAVDALGAVDQAHAAAAELLAQRERADAKARQRGTGRGGSEDLREAERDRARGGAREPRVGLEQCLDP